jgi:hypothetical protein
MSNNIWVAAADGKQEEVEKLISSGQYTPNSADPNGFTPIHAAASYGHLDLLRYLLNNGGNADIQDSDGDTPLHHTESLEVARLLIGEFGANYRLKNKDGLNVKEYFIEEGEFPEIIQFFELLEKTGDINAQQDPSTSPAGSLNLPNGQEIKAFLSDNIDAVTGNGEGNDANTPEMIERRKQVEAIFSNSDLTEEERDSQLRDYVMGVVSSNMGKLREGADESESKRKRD